MQNHNEIIDHYEAAGLRLKKAIAGLTTEDMNAVPVEGKWSIQQLVIHVTDAELAFVDRMKRVITSDNPQLLAWNENAYMANLSYAEQSAEDAAATVELLRRQMARVLRKLPAQAFERTGTHSERGRQTLSEIIGFANAHLDHHLTFLYDKREKLGKLMW